MTRLLPQSFLHLASLLCVAGTLALTTSASAQDATHLDAILETNIDAVLRPHFKADEPGATVIVTRNGKVIYRNAFGLANLAVKTPLKPDDVLRIGSITKQFTAVAVLLLADQGKLSLADPITKYLTDYPNVGDSITIEHLLTHTSGVPSYTNMPDYHENRARAMTVQDMIARFKDQPLNFTPGSRWEYSNSGYFLLGAIIERVAGMRYADFVANHIFVPLDMQNTAFEGFERSTKRRVEGYADRTNLAPHIDMSQPYAAGSLVSTVDDLAKWDAAITAGKLLKQTTWKQTFTPFTLSNGKTTAYGYGWQVRKLQGMDALAHGGGIDGFVSMGIRVPESKIYVAMLGNRSGGGGAAPQFLAEKITAIAMGKPYKDFKSITLDDAALDKHIGVYRIDEKTTRTVTREGSQLFIQRTGGSKGAIMAASATDFFMPNSFVTYTFETDANGETTHLVVSQSSGVDRSPRIAKTPPAATKGVTLTAAAFDQYAGTYTLAPGIIFTVSRMDDKFFAQVTGQEPLEILAEAEDKFFVKLVDAKINFMRDASGKVVQLTLIQRGRERVAKRNP